MDSSAGHSSSAMLMLLSVVFVGLAVFLIYKFKRYALLSLSVDNGARFLGADASYNQHSYTHPKYAKFLLFEALFGTGGKQEWLRVQEGINGFKDLNFI